MPDFERILITGAAGSLGARRRRGLAPLARRLRLVDVRDFGAAAPHEELLRLDLADRDAAIEAARDCDAIVHFAGHPREIGFRPQDSADPHIAEVLAGAPRPDPRAVATRAVGGSFAATGHPDDG